MTSRKLVYTALFAALTAAGAFLRIPLGVSSITLQCLFTAMAGVLLGAGCGALSQAVYVALGLIGLPIFTTGGGFAYVLQPTFGFLLGLIPAAAVIGALTRKNFGFVHLALACCAGLAVLYLIGLPYLHGICTLYLHKQRTIWETMMGGMIIFLPWDALKIVAVALLGQRLCPLLRKSA